MYTYAARVASLGDDVFGTDECTNTLEAHVANLAGKEAGLFALSGTMSNQLALRTHLTQPPYRCICSSLRAASRGLTEGVAVYLATIELMSGNMKHLEHRFILLRSLSQLDQRMVRYVLVVTLDLDSLPFGRPPPYRQRRQDARHP
jgi:7-keto-8-aminopelargonate synthetase-like enzyme